MCTLLFAWRPTPGTLLAVASNRNEFLARPAEGLQLWPEEKGVPRIAAPRDLKAGGTWLGVNGRGLFVCLTNRKGATLSADRRSRGQLVAEALKLPSAAAVDAWLGTLHGADYNGFHLVAADATDAFLAIGDGQLLQRERLRPGLHLITERSFGAGEGEREERARAAYAALFAAGEPTAASLRGPMQAHGEPGQSPLESACVHAEMFGYGTRSSLELVVPERGPVQALWSEGKTCTSLPQDVSALLEPLFHGR
jgi:uncharacterized protein with NRDE domain